MKLNIIVIVILGFSILFVTNQAYAPCIEGPGINCNNYPPPALTQINTDKLNYETSDKPIVTIIGAPDAVAHLEIDDSSSNIIFTHDINLAPNETVKYVLDISSYKPGVYSVIATSPISKLTTSFAVGLEPAGHAINPLQKESVQTSQPIQNKILSPLKQFNSGVAVENISCKEGLYLALKLHNQEPVCLKAGTISKLASRGFFYGTNESPTNYTTILIPPGSEDPSSNKTYSPDVATVVLGINNTVRWVNQAKAANTIVSDMPLQQDGKSFGGSTLIPGKSYEFTFTEPGTFGYHGEPHPWQRGKIIVLPQINNSYNRTSQIIPQCVSDIQNQYAIAGPPGAPICPYANFVASDKILNATGFYGIYNYTSYPGTLNYVLEPGHNGTIMFLIHMGMIHHNASTVPYFNQINITNDIVFMHDAGMHDHPGVDVLVEPKSQMIRDDGTSLVTMRFSVSKDALPGVYWVTLPPGFCVGGQMIILTVTDCEK